MKEKKERNEEIVKQWEKGKTMREIASFYNVDLKVVHRVVSRYRQKLSTSAS